MTFTFRLIQDEALIRQAIMAPNNAPWSFEDGYDVASWNVNPSSGVLSLGCFHGQEFLGIVGLIPQGKGRLEAHIAFLPAIYGNAAQVGRECREWIWRHMGAETVIAPCLECNSLAKRFLTHIGFTHHGYADKTWLKDGENHRIMIFEVQNPHNIREG
jgi:RimJ/RimL family protein N-acetyltransferase